MASNYNILSKPDDNELSNVNQIDEDEDTDEDNIVIKTQNALAITGGCSNVQVLQIFGNVEEANSTRGKDDVFRSNLSVDKMKKILKRIYTNLSLPMAPWLEAGENLLVHDYFVQLELEDTKKTISLENIFIEEEQKREINWIYVEASPGFGKTTLAYKLITDWVANEEYVQKFDLAFLVILRYLRGKNVKTTLSKIVNQENDEKVWDLINNEKTLIIFDGLDEIDDRDKNKILDLQFDGTIVLTGRTGSYRIEIDAHKKLEDMSGVQKSNRFWDRHITITGIDGGNRFVFLKQFFDQNSTWEIIKNRIVELNYSLSEMYRSPLMLLLLANGLSENPQLNIDNIQKTELYKNLTNCLIVRSQSKINKNFESGFNLFSDLVSTNYEIVEVFDKFGSISLKNLTNNNLQFEANEIVKKIYDMGFLIKHETIEIFKTKVHYEALHLSMIEFATAISLWLSYKTNKKFTIDQLIFVRDFIIYKKETSLVVPFLCGLMGEKVNELFNQLKPHWGLLSSSDLSFLLVECNKNDLFGESISHLIPTCLEILSHKPLNELLQLIEYGIQFQKLKHIIIDSNYLEYLPSNLTGVNLLVKGDMFIRKIVQLKCKKVNFVFSRYRFHDLELGEKFAIDTFNNIDSASKKIEIHDLDALIVFVRKKCEITRLDELKFEIDHRVKSDYITTIEKFVALVIKNCRVKTLELQYTHIFSAIDSLVPIEKLINLISKFPFLKSINIDGPFDVTDFNLIADLYNKTSLDSVYFHDVLLHMSENPIKLFPRIETMPILRGNQSMIEKISNCLYRVFCKKVCDNESCSFSIRMLKSKITRSTRGFDSIIELRFHYSKLMSMKYKDVFLKSVIYCKQVRTITFYFNEIKQMVDYTNECQNLPELFFSKIDLVIEIHIGFDNGESDVQLVMEMIKIKRVNKLILFTDCYRARPFFKLLSLFSNFFPLVARRQIDKLEIHISCYGDVLIFISDFDVTKLELACDNYNFYSWEGYFYTCSFNVTRKM